MTKDNHFLGGTSPTSLNLNAKDYATLLFNLIIILGLETIIQASPVKLQMGSPHHKMKCPTIELGGAPFCFFTWTNYGAPPRPFNIYNVSESPGKPPGVGVFVQASLIV